MLPVCGIPEALFGEPITNLDPNGLDWCMEPIYNNPHDAASSTYGVFMANGMETIMKILVKSKKIPLFDFQNFLTNDIFLFKKYKYSLF